MAIIRYICFFIFGALTSVFELPLYQSIILLGLAALISITPYFEDV